MIRSKKKSNHRTLIFLVTLALIFSLMVSVEAQNKPTVLSIATGGTGAVYYPMGGGMANVLTKYIPNCEVNAEVTAASVDNVRLVHARKSDLGFTMCDVAYDALRGEGRFKNMGRIPIRAIAVVFSNSLHFVARVGSGINSVWDLRGKRVSTGPPGSGTEVKAVRVLESYGINADRDIKRERLSHVEGAGAMRDRKLDAIIIETGVPNSTVLDLSATPGIRIKLLSSVANLDKLRQKYGPVYFQLTVPKGIYPHQDSDIQMVGTANLLFCHENMDPGLVYTILKVLLEHQPEIVLSHAEAKSFTLNNAVVGSPISFHPGAVKYFEEKKITIK